MRNSIEYFTDVKSLTKFDKVISYEKSDRISHTYILPKCVTCKKFDRILLLVRNSIQYFTAVKVWKNRFNSPHSCVTFDRKHHLLKKYVPVSHTYNSPKCVTCNTPDQIYLARDKFDRKLPCCKNNSTELFLVMTYLIKYMTCEKSDRISHTYISPKMFPFIKNL